MFGIAIPPGGAHPRSRGEHLAQWNSTAVEYGSSPLTRGALLAEETQLARDRLIPAHAGSTHRRIIRDRAVRAHPRSRGEHGRKADLTQPQRGSSPLTRGAPGGFGGVTRDEGLIPAHAGSTSRNSQSGVSEAAHPRSRGEHEVTPPTALSYSGSSPLTRGARKAHGLDLATVRLIPAHAGSTVVWWAWVAGASAHPRSRGEHCISMQRSRSSFGSSPLTRGAPLCSRLPDVELRLIPAHAGSTGRGSL